ncbi:unnamed protein product [Mytilus edulis]|uniref:Uncharacterized protein n=1 Tax=Mytilus edulis TaxID=6550 RepID=A0A8S3RTT2_MYTED|nr:unnamed protein product [Mytilus edulis]
MQTTTLRCQKEYSTVKITTMSNYQNSQEENLQNDLFGQEITDTPLPRAPPAAGCNSTTTHCDCCAKNTALLQEIFRKEVETVIVLNSDDDNDDVKIKQEREEKKVKTDSSICVSESDSESHVVYTATEIEGRDRTGKKANPNVVATAMNEDGERLFALEQCLQPSQIMSYISRLALLTRTEKKVDRTVRIADAYVDDDNLVDILNDIEMDHVGEQIS